MLPATAEFLLPLSLFIMVSSITPGPNNLMLTASGATFGYRRSVPHMLGISLGAALMLLLVGSGLGTAFTRWPWSYSALKWVGAAYLLWLAWKIARAGQADGRGQPSQPFGFWQAAGFQWVNPKAWIMSVGVVATYTPQQGYWSHLWLAAAVMLVVNYPCISVWTLFGSGVRRWLRSPQALRLFNWSMAALLVLSLYPMIREA